VLRDVPEVLLLGVRRDGSVLRWFELEDPLRAGDVLLAIGTNENLAGLQQAASLPAAAPASAVD
jgi:uncharacterized protein with PhoU and TrkA domain